ncbi:TetR/AcrR family transcriptional regulator [Oceanobacillus halotolerans]|uniref:TetR/AcrR family transcriptional regulator n=1 Tax=Oceanobacillus halotolerans TaxID=2663380 RepID=UPI0013DA8EE4|nr:TetR/AcrR family transcriptional regulator [Oceanobacillus halotolerans]
MKEKERILMETGMALFAEKGYHQTSIQEIATTAGVSKGAFYLYFTSKEDFIQSAFHYYHTKLNEQLEMVIQEKDPPKISFTKQIGVITDYVYHYKDFIIMMVRENITIGEDIDRMIRQMKMDNYAWIRKNLQAIYGEKRERYFTDVAIQLEGLMIGYFKWIVMDQLEIEPQKVSTYLMNRLDDLIEGMIARNEIPLLTETDIPFEYKKSASNASIEKRLETLREKIKFVNLTKAKQQQISDALAIIEKEVNKEKPQSIVIQGMLAHMQTIPALIEDCKQIAALLNIELLDKERS